MFKKGTIFRKITFSLIPVLIFGFATIAWLTIHFSKKALTSQIQHDLDNSSFALQEVIKTQVEQRYKDIILLKDNPLISQALKWKKYDLIFEFFSKLKKDLKFYSAIQLFDHSGRMVASNSKAMHKYLLAKGYNDQSKESWYQSGIQGKIGYTRLTQSSTFKSLVITFFAPIYIENSIKPAGVIRLVYAWKHIYDHLVRLEGRLKEKGIELRKYCIADGRGTILYHPNKDLVLTPISDSAGKDINANQIVDLYKEVFLDQDLTSHTVVAESRFDLAFKFIQIVSQDRKEALAPITQLSLAIAVTTLVVVIVLLTIVLVQTRSIVHPLLAVARTMKIIVETGDFDKKIHFSASKEIEELTDTFNTLTENLQSTTVSKEFTDNIIESLDEMLFVTSPNGSIVRNNRQAEEILGYTEEEFASMQLSSVAMDGSEDSNFVKQIIFTGSIKALQTQLKSKEGEAIPVVVNGKCLVGSQGELKAIILSAKDMRAQLKLEEERNKKKMFEESVTRIRGQYIEQAGDRKGLLGFCLEELQTLTQSNLGLIGDVFFDEDKKPYVKTVSFVASNTDEDRGDLIPSSGVEFRDMDSLIGKPVVSRKPFFTDSPSKEETPSGFPQVTSYLGLPLLKGDTPVALIALANSEERYDQEIVEQAGLVAHAISDILSLFDAEKKAKSNQDIALQNAKLASIGELAAGVGHEINNPLAIALGNVERIERVLKKESFENEKVTKAIDNHKNAVARIRRIVDGLRTYARNSSDEQETLFFNDVIDHTLGLVTDIFTKKGIELEVNLCPDGPFVSGNLGKLQQVMMNLISNARDAVDEQPTKKIEIRSRIISETEVAFYVTDNGCGMTEEVRKRMFDPFFTTKDVGKGTGMGMGITQKIIEEHNGKIEVHSAIGMGTTFKITFPLLQLSQEERDRFLNGPEEEATPESMVNQNEVPNKVIVVDDEEGVREVLMDILEMVGVPNIDEAENGAVALKKIKEEEYDYVFTDVQMPELDGPGLIKAIDRAKLPRRPKIIIVTGGVASHFTEENKLGESVDAFLFKPFETKDILEIFATPATRKDAA